MGDATYKVIGGHEVNMPKIDVDVHVAMPELRELLEKEQLAPVVNVNLPIQEPAVVHVEVPAPVINVAAPSVTVENPENHIQVHVPEMNPPAIEIHPQMLNITPTTKVLIQMNVDRQILLFLTIGVYLLFISSILHFFHFL